MIAFILGQALLLGIAAVVSYGAGAPCSRNLPGGSFCGAIAVSSAAGLAVLGMCFFLLGLSGALNRWQWPRSPSRPPLRRW